VEYCEIADVCSDIKLFAKYQETPHVWLKVRHDFARLPYTYINDIIFLPTLAATQSSLPCYHIHNAWHLCPPSATTMQSKDVTMFFEEGVFLNSELRGNSCFKTRYSFKLVM